MRAKALNLKHLNGVPECPLCVSKMTQAHPDLVQWFTKFVKPNFPLAHISWSFRDQKNQDQCFIDGKSKLKWPHSEHNKCDETGKPQARALDLFELDLNGMGCWHWSFFRDIDAANAVSSIKIEWAGNWIRFSEADHFQLSTKDELS